MSVSFFPVLRRPQSQSILVEALEGRPVAERRIELVERKGIGHPDTMCDALPDVRPGVDLRVRSALAPGSVALTRILRHPESVVVSNDTSGASGYAPRTVTEETVLAVEHFLNSAEFKRDFPDSGVDVKVFGRRQDDALELTVAMPLSCRAIPSRRSSERRSPASRSGSSPAVRW